MARLSNLLRTRSVAGKLQPTHRRCIGGGDSRSFFASRWTVMRCGEAAPFGGDALGDNADDVAKEEAANHLQQPIGEKENRGKVEETVCHGAQLLL